MGGRSFFSSRTSKFAIVWPSLPATRPEMGSWTPPKHPNITTSPFLTLSTSRNANHQNHPFIYHVEELDLYSLVRPWFSGATHSFSGARAEEPSATVALAHSSLLFVSAPSLDNDNKIYVRFATIHIIKLMGRCTQMTPLKVGQLAAM